MVRDVDVKGEMRGKVDFDGFCQVVAKQQGSSYDTHGEILQAFHHIDGGGDQAISVEDLKRACARVKLKLSEAELQVIAAAVCMEVFTLKGRGINQCT